MKNLIYPALLLISIYSNVLVAQPATTCEQNIGFSMLPNHQLTDCEEKEFEKLAIYTKDKTGNRVTGSKEGFFTKASYKWLGEWAKRPSNTQIYRNYEQAALKNGGEILFSADWGLFFRYKKGDENFYVNVSTDGSGYYYVTSLKEATMNQDVAYTAAEMEAMMESEGQISFYNIYFDTDKATLQPASAPAIEGIATYLKAHSNKRVFIVGHTDNTGSAAYNMKLSKERAIAVVTDLAVIHGVASTQITAEGVGPLAPATSNQTETSRAKNRRVVMVLAN
jgi:outer membrane protein OmpA-like peptidoglycan-associated protein